jgi:hypothetical protein
MAAERTGRGLICNTKRSGRQAVLWVQGAKVQIRTMTEVVPNESQQAFAATF